MCVDGARAEGGVPGTREEGAPEREEEGAWEHCGGCGGFVRGVVKKVEDGALVVLR